MRQLEFLGSCNNGIRAVFIRMTDPAAPGPCGRFGFPFGTDEAEAAIRIAIAHNRLRLMGLHVRVGLDEHAYISRAAAIGNMIAEMEHILRDHGPLLTGLGIDCDVWNGNCGDELRELAAVIDDALEDACAAMRFPRPRVLLTAGASTLGSLTA